MFSFLLKFLLPAALAFGCGLAVAHHWDEGAIADLKLADKTAQAQALRTALALQKKQDAVTLAAALREAAVQQKIATHTVTLTREIPVYVSPRIDSRTCIPYGLVRVLDAAVLGADPAALSLPAGQSDDACAPVDASALAASIAANYGAARANAEQLGALQGWVLGMARAAQ